MNENESRHIQDVARQQISESKTVTLKRNHTGKMFATRTDFGMMVALGPSKNLAEENKKFVTSSSYIKKCIWCLRALRRIYFRNWHIPCRIRNPRTMVLREHCLENDEDILKARHRTNSVPASYIPGPSTLTLRCAIDGDGPVVGCISRWSVRRIVAAEKYWANADGRVDTVVVVERRLW